MTHGLSDRKSKIRLYALDDKPTGVVTIDTDQLSKSPNEEAKNFLESIRNRERLEFRLAEKCKGKEQMRILRGVKVTGTSKKGDLVAVDIEWESEEFVDMVPGNS